jgi:hypothetical protein
MVKKSFSTAVERLEKMDALVVNADDVVDGALDGGSRSNGRRLQPLFGPEF